MLTESSCADPAVATNAASINNKFFISLIIDVSLVPRHWRHEVLDHNKFLIILIYGVTNYISVFPNRNIPYHQISMLI
jgi:hypothetical protein